MQLQGNVVLILEVKIYKSKGDIGTEISIIRHNPEAGSRT